jgi:hypothetical protein
MADVMRVPKRNRIKKFIVSAIQEALLPFWVALNKRMVKVMAQIDDLTAIVTKLEGDAATVASFVASEQTALQTAINELNQHPVATSDPAIGALITRLQSVSTNLESVTATGPTAPAAPAAPTDPTVATTPTGPTTTDPNAAANTAPAQQPAATTSPTAPTAPAAPATPAS